MIFTRSFLAYFQLSFSSEKISYRFEFCMNPKFHKNLFHSGSFNKLIDGTPNRTIWLILFSPSFSRDFRCCLFRSQHVRKYFQLKKISSGQKTPFENNLNAQLKSTRKNLILKAKKKNKRYAKKNSHNLFHLNQFKFRRRFRQHIIARCLPLRFRICTQISRSSRITKGHFGSFKRRCRAIVSTLTVQSERDQETRAISIFHT